MIFYLFNFLIMVYGLYSGGCPLYSTGSPISSGSLFYSCTLPNSSAYFDNLYFMSFVLFSLVFIILWFIVWYSFIKKL